MEKENSPYMTAEELAEYLRVKPGWVYKRTRLNLIPGQVKIGGAVRIDRETVQAAIRSGELKMEGKSDAA